MQLFIIGNTKSGKTLLSNLFFPYNFDKYEAGEWARDSFAEQTGKDKYSNEIADKELMTKLAIDTLRSNPLHSVEVYKDFLRNQCTREDVIISGVRNPVDFVNMLRFSDKNAVIFLGGGQETPCNLSDFEVLGNEIIKNIVKWENNNTNLIKAKYFSDNCNFKDINFQNLIEWAKK